MNTLTKFATLVLTILLFSPNTVKAQCHFDDWTALKAFYENTNGDNWTNRTGWEIIVSTLPPANCSLANLYGVGLDTNNRVSCLDFDGDTNCGYSNNAGGNNLRGTIPSELNKLSNLTVLFLRDNELSGSIPTGLGGLKNLTYLHLSGNQLSGNIPSEIGNLTLLSRLILFDNQLSGSIPPELGNLTNLTYLHAEHNQLSGTTPIELGKLSNLESLHLAHNKLTGNIPPELENLNNLKAISFANNELSGSIPPELGNLNNLTYLNLKGNKLTGNIPITICNLPKLTGLYLHYNSLTGSIPNEIGNLTKLTELYLSSNELSGSIPATLGNLTDLRWLRLYGNQLSGSIPPQLGNLSNLTWLEINDNEIAGCYSDNIASLCGQLTSEYFDGNPDISDGNNFNATWEDFCATGISSCIVYPGDLNYDGIVNNVDLGLSGLYKTEIGPQRSIEHQNIDWYDHPANNWGTQQLNNRDIKHYDCNGDGFIDVRDHQAVLDNMGENWTIQTPPTTSSPQSDYQVTLHPIKQISEDFLIMNIALERRTGSELTIQGGHFTIDYNNVEGNIDYVTLGLKNESWLGDRDNDLLYEITDLPSQQKIEVGFTKSNNLNSEGSGIIGDLILSFDNSLARHTGMSNNVYEFQVNTVGVHNGTTFTPIEDQLLQVDVSNGSCQPNWTITEDTPFRNEYKSNGTIVTNGFVLIGEEQQVDYQASQITLNAGFEVKAGANFMVGYGYCD